MIPIYKLWLHGLYGLYGPRCPLSPEKPINIITHSLFKMLQLAWRLDVVWLYIGKNEMTSFSCGEIRFSYILIYNFVLGMQYAAIFPSVEDIPLILIIKSNLQFCTGHGIVIVVLCEIFCNDCTTEMDITDEHDFTHLNIRWVPEEYPVLQPTCGSGLICPLIMNHPRLPLDKRLLFICTIKHGSEWWGILMLFCHFVQSCMQAEIYSYECWWTAYVSSAITVHLLIQSLDTPSQMTWFTNRDQLVMDLFNHRTQQMNCSWS